MLHCSVPSYVNTSLVSWCAGLRPLVLMTRVATVSELMAMQSCGASAHPHPAPVQPSALCPHHHGLSASGRARGP